MVDIGATFGGLIPGLRRLSLTGAAGISATSRGVFSGLRLIDTVADIVASSALPGRWWKIRRAAGAEGGQRQRAGRGNMVELMRGRVGGRHRPAALRHHLRPRGRHVVVRAAADRGGYGLRPGGGDRAPSRRPVADGDLFADTTGVGGRQVRDGPTDVEAQPFFYGSAREALSDWAASSAARARKDCDCPLPHHPFRDALRAHLRASDAFKALAGNRIFVEVADAEAERAAGGHHALRLHRSDASHAP